MSRLSPILISFVVALALVAPLPSSVALSNTADVRPRTPLVVADWPQFHNKAKRTGVNSVESILKVTNVVNLELDWKKMTGQAIIGSPAVAKGILYFGSMNEKFYAVDAVTGTTLWTVTTGGEVDSSPAVVDGVVYFGSDDQKVRAYDAVSGVRLWTRKLGGRPSGSSPAVSGGLLYIGALDGYTYAIDTATGVVKWTVNTWNVRGSAAVSGGIVYVGSDKSTLYALDAKTGVTKWTAKVGDFIQSTPSVSNGVVYVGARDYRVRAYDALTGALRWKTSVLPHLGAVKSSPAIWGGKVFVATAETDPMGSHVYAFDINTGAEVWNHTMADYSSSSPAIANGVLYVGSFDHQLYAFNASTGTKIWTSGFDMMQGGIPSSPAVVNGVVYVGSIDGGLYAYSLP